MKTAPKTCLSYRIDRLFHSMGWNDNELNTVSGSTIQKIRNQNYRPSNKTLGNLARGLQEKGVQITFDELLELRDNSYGKDIDPAILSDAGKSRDYLAEPAFSKQMADSISKLNASKDVKQSIVRVLTHSNYPRMMAISDRLVRNPVWQDSLDPKQTEMLRVNSLAGISPPVIKHLDIHLIRRNNDVGRGELLNYWSRWNTYLLYFREQTPEDNPSQRTTLNERKYAKFFPGHSNYVSVKPLQGKYAVSVKLDAEYGDLKIYLFEFCSVVFSLKPPFFDTKEAAITNLPKYKWRDLDSMRADPETMAKNADVIRAIHELFTVGLGPHLPVSFVDHHQVKRD